MAKIEIYTDGGCRGNGGQHPKGYASIAIYYKEKERRRFSQELPSVRTNNEAEYSSLLMAMSYIDGLKNRSTAPLPNIVIYTDSQLLYGQLLLGFRVKAANLRPLYEAAIDWLMDHPEVELAKVDREKIVAVLGH